MIEKIQLLHYLNENTYKKICHKLTLDDSGQKTKENFIAYDNEKIYRINLFNIIYQQFGHIFFMHINIDFPKFNCSYEDFSVKLYERYNEIFGADIMSDFPTYDQLNCDYIEYSTVLAVANANTIINRLNGVRCEPEQLDCALWNKFKKPHGTIEFCLCADDDNHLRTLARCHGTALKKRIKDTQYHRATGLTPSVVVKTETESKLVSWLLFMHGISKVQVQDDRIIEKRTNKNELTPSEMVSMLPAEKLEDAMKFIRLAKQLDLKAATRFAFGHKTWKSVFSKRKPARVLFTLECTQSRWNIKICLFNIEKYKNIFSECSENIQNTIKNAYDCKKCNDHCKGGCEFEINSVKYRKCISCCFYFQDQCNDDWDSLIRLITAENSIVMEKQY